MVFFFVFDSPVLLLLHTVHVDESQRFTLCQNIIDTSHKCMVEVYFSKFRDTSHLSSWNCTRNFSFTQAHKWMISFIFFLFKLREVTNVSHYYIYQIIVSEMKYCFEMLLFFLETASENCFLFHRFSDWNRIWIIEVSRYWDLPAESLDIISS